MGHGVNKTKKRMAFEDQFDRPDLYSLQCLPQYRLSVSLMSAYSGLQ